MSSYPREARAAAFLKRQVAPLRCLSGPGRGSGTSPASRVTDFRGRGRRLETSFLLQVFEGDERPQ